MTGLVDGEQTFLYAVFEAVDVAETYPDITIYCARQLAEQLPVNIMIAAVGQRHPCRPALFVGAPTGSGWLC